MFLPFCYKNDKVRKNRLVFVNTKDGLGGVNDVVVTYLIAHTVLSTYEFLELTNEFIVLNEL